MQFFISNLALPVGGAVTLVASFLFLLRAEILLIIRADRYLVLARGKAGKKRYRTLKKGVHFRVPFWEIIVGVVPRGERTYEWDIGTKIAWENGCVLAIPSYVMSVRIQFTDDQQAIQRVARRGLEPNVHIHECVQATITRPERRLSPDSARFALYCRLKLDAAEHGYKAVSVSTYTEGN